MTIQPLSYEDSELYRVRVESMLLHDRVYEVGDLVSKDTVGAAYVGVLVNNGYLEPVSEPAPQSRFKLFKRLSRVR
jgi:hypothetical protein